MEVSPDHPLLSGNFYLRKFRHGLKFSIQRKCPPVIPAPKLWNCTWLLSHNISTMSTHIRNQVEIILSIPCQGKRFIQVILQQNKWMNILCLFHKVSTPDKLPGRRKYSFPAQRKDLRTIIKIGRYGSGFGDIWVHTEILHRKSCLLWQFKKDSLSPAIQYILFFHRIPMDNFQEIFPKKNLYRLIKMISCP